MAERLRDFTNMNPPIFTRSKTSSSQEFMHEVHKILVAMGATYTEKVELSSYHLKDIAQTWCKMWQDSRALGGVPVRWELFKIAFLERFFPREMRESKVVSNSRDDLIKFLTWIVEDLVEECRAAMLHDSIDLSTLMVHVQQVEEIRKRKHKQVKAS